MYNSPSYTSPSHLFYEPLPQQVETAANKVQSAATTSADALVQEEEEESDDDDDDLSSVRTTLELEYATAIDSVDTATDEFYTFKTTLESKLGTNLILKYVYL